MCKLAYNNNAVLIKCGNEYWVIKTGFAEHGCWNSQSKNYNAKDALRTFEVNYGKALYLHPRLDSL